MNYKKLFRHGDVDGIPIELTSLKLIPKAAKPIGDILAYGEASGHHHRAKNAQVFLLEKPIQVEVAGEQLLVEKFLRVKQEIQLEHEEHPTIPLQKGEYILPGERQYNPFDAEIMKVMD